MDATIDRHRSARTNAPTAVARAKKRRRNIFMCDQMRIEKARAANSDQCRRVPLTSPYGVSLETPQNIAKVTKSKMCRQNRTRQDPSQAAYEGWIPFARSKIGTGSTRRLWATPGYLSFTITGTVASSQDDGAEP